MKFEIYVFLLLIYEAFFVKGQTINDEKNDCTKYYNFMLGNNKDYSADDCCREYAIKCKDGYITDITGLVFI